uniref:C2H2-type domain-containing protein n=1 Tax=Acrobeloides nanus TaxID=290746 RepID=A0A914CJM8_9BILA
MVPSQCPQCDFRPSSASQLTHHVRAHHTSIQAYICLLCAYKGYSARGIKSHLKNAHADEVDGSAVETRFTDYVFPITTDAKLFPCERCNLSFPTKELIQRHSCAEVNLKSTIEN